MTPVAGKVAAVTGAGSGIGRALAVELAARGARLSISDLNELGLEETARLAEERGAAVDRQVLDVGDRDAFAAYADLVAGEYGVVHQIYNNAGIAFSRPVLDSTYEDYERIFAVNLWGVIHGTKAFLPHLIESGDGHIVNVSSLNGYLAQGGMTHYCTSKFAVRGFTEAVRMEMLSEGHPVQVSSVHPGGIKTNIADAAFASAQELGLPVTDEDERRRKAYNEKLLRMDPAQAARVIVNGVEKGRGRILVGQDAKIVDAFVRLLPARYPKVALAVEGRLAR